MTQVHDWFSLYRLLVKSKLKARSAYRLNYVLSLVMQMFLSAAELGAVLLILHRVHTIGGWSADEITFLFGLIVFSSGTYRIFGSELHDFDKYLVNGEFDAVLTRPAPALLTLMARSMDVEHVGRLIQGVIILIVEFIRLGPSHGFNVLTVFEIVYAMICGAIIWFAMVITVATIGFWTTRIDELQPVFLYGPETATSYPLNIYPRVIQAIFYSVMPVAFGAYVPASLMLHKGMPPSLWCVTGLVSVITICLALGFWSLGIRRYTSTGT
ncbi:MAG: ABC-2 family transporter protein [Alicyclobacillus sp.]|nr:ABC-2 family transporter protein [Alicyclobacillus sp.]